MAVNKDVLSRARNIFLLSSLPLISSRPLYSSLLHLYCIYAAEMLNGNARFSNAFRILRATDKEFLTPKSPLF